MVQPTGQRINRSLIVSVRLPYMTREPSGRRADCFRLVLPAVFGLISRNSLESAFFCAMFFQARGLREAIGSKYGERREERVRG